MIEQLELLLKTILELILLLLNPMILFPVLIIIGINYYKNKKYKEEAYYKITNITYSDVRHDVGKYGEYLIYKYLKEFENQGAKFLFNIYVPKKDEETTEIDVLMISNDYLYSKVKTTVVGFLVMKQKSIGIKLFHRDIKEVIKKNFIIQYFKIILT